MRYADYTRLEKDYRDQLGRLAQGSPLYLIAARNDLPSLAMFRALLEKGKAAGMADNTTIEGLNTKTLINDDRIGLFSVSDTGRTDPGIVCFTSGVTGTPRAIFRRYESWLRSFKMQRSVLGYAQDCRVLIMGNMAHSMHLFGAMECLDRGIVPSILSRFSPKHVLSDCNDLRINMLYATPTHLNMIAEYASAQKVMPVASVTHILTGGAKFHESREQALKRLFPNARVVEFFGTTETSYITMKEPQSPAGSVGKACPGVSISIRDEDNSALPANAVGTLWVKSDMLFDRYLTGQDDNTRWHDGYLTVGDQGYVDGEGNFYFTARKGLMVTIAGENVFLDVVEHFLRNCLPDIESVVVPIADDLRGYQLVAVTQTPLACDVQDRVLRKMRDKFGPLKAPRAFQVVSDWPCLPSGKVDRNALVTHLHPASG